MWRSAALLSGFILTASTSPEMRATEAGSLRVNSPSVLRGNWGAGKTAGVISMSPAMFGRPAYSGVKISGVVAYAPEACVPLTRNETVGWPENDPMGRLNVILMVDRGDCTFVTKVKNAEMIGAVAVVIVDNKPDLYLPYMGDDGHGTDVEIPSMLIHQNDGAKIRDYIHDETQTTEMVTMTLKWDYRNTDNRVEWDLWTSAEVAETYDFFDQFKPVIEGLGDSAYLTPHIFSNQYACQVLDDECRASCTNNGRYCARSYDDEGVMKGYPVIQENVRRMCAWRTLNMTKGVNTLLYVDYVTQVRNTCTQEMMDGDGESMTACSLKLFQEVGFDTAAINKCVKDSGTTDVDSDTLNTILEEERDKQWNVYLISFTHTLLVNGRHYSGGTQCPDPSNLKTCGVLENICWGFKDLDLVPACNTDVGCAVGEQRDGSAKCGGTCQDDRCGQCLEKGHPNWNTCLGCDDVPFSMAVNDSCGVCNGEGVVCGTCLSADDIRRVDGCPKPVISTSGFPAWKVVCVVLGCVLVVSVGVYMFMQHRQKRLKQDIDSLLKQYLPMDDLGEAAAGGRVAIDGNL